MSMTSPDPGGSSRSTTATPRSLPRTAFTTILPECYSDISELYSARSSRRRHGLGLRDRPRARLGARAWWHERRPMSDDVVQERHSNVLVVRINRPEARNAINGAVARGIAHAVAEAEDDSEIRALVVTGTGDRAFCAGMDLRTFADGGVADVPADYRREVNGKVSVPVLAAVNGFAVGGGCEIALACDVVVASETATFGLPEVKRGLFPGVGLMHIAQRLPLGVALELALTGERIDAARAYELGFVNKVVP